MRILIVDDHEVIRRSLKTLLTNEHIEVCGEAADGVEAVAKAKQLNPSVINYGPHDAEWMASKPPAKSDGTCLKFKS